MILNIHVPKTAGTSFRFALAKRFGEHGLAFDYGDDSPVTSDIVKQHLYSKERKPDPGALIEALRSSDCVAVVGHFPYAKFARYFEPEEVITFVREPLARAASEYLHRQRRDEIFEGTFETFIETPKHQNVQARNLRGLPGGALVGLTERYGPALKLINTRFGLKLKHRRDNRSPRGGAAKFVKQLDPDLIQRFYELNQDDVALYGELSARFVCLTERQRRSWFRIRH